MKKLVPLLVILTLLLTPTFVFANPKDNVYFEWDNGQKMAYFKKTASGLVLGWSPEEHPNAPNSHWVIKPLDKFPNAMTCDEGATFEMYGLTPSRIYPDSEYESDFYQIFPTVDEEYLICIYPDQ